jgi:hypothetical protein
MEDLVLRPGHVLMPIHALARLLAKDSNSSTMPTVHPRDPVQLIQPVRSTD